MDAENGTVCVTSKIQLRWLSDTFRKRSDYWTCKTCILHIRSHVAWELHTVYKYSILTVSPLAVMFNALAESALLVAVLFIITREKANCPSFMHLRLAATCYG